MKIHKTPVGDIAVFVLSLLGLLWLLLLLAGPLGLYRFGIIPRTLAGLPGILLSPFLHGNAQHLIANSLPLVIFGVLVFVLEGRRTLSITLSLIFFSGLGTWLIGRGDSVHIGASGLIYGYFGYLLVAGFYKREPLSIIVGVVVGLLYGGLVWGVLPRQCDVSWEGHLCGLLAGVGDAKVRWERRRA